jgi:hypothetical protein
MFVIAKNKNKDLDEYVKREDVSTMKNEPIRRGSKKRQYTYNVNGVKCTSKGLTGYLKRNFIKNYKEPRRAFKKDAEYRRDCSSKALGKRVDREISLYIKKTHCKFKSRSKKPTHPLTLAILELWQRSELIPIASQIPVVVCDGVCTQVDVILMDAQGKLWMHEIKTGGLKINNEKGHFAHPYNHEKCTKRAQWDLQRHYGHQSLTTRGLPLVGSKVVHAFISTGVARAVYYPNVFN